MSNQETAFENFLNKYDEEIFRQSARSRWQIFWHGSIINRFLAEVKDATVQVVPVSED